MLKATAAQTTSQRCSHRPGTPPNGPDPTGAGQRWLFQMTLKHCRPSPAWAIAPPCNPPFPPQTRALHSFLSFLGALIKIPAKSELLPHWPSRGSVLFPTTFLITNIAAHPDSGKYVLLRLSPCSRLPGRAGPFVCTESPALGTRPCGGRRVSGCWPPCSPGGQAPQGWACRCPFLVSVLVSSFSQMRGLGFHEVKEPALGLWQSSDQNLGLVTPTMV